MECDYCGEYCAQLGVEQPAPFSDSGWIPPSSIGLHNAIVGRIVDCSIREGGDYIASHVGPWHGKDGRPLDACPHCDSSSWMNAGYWDGSLDHEMCPDCWGQVAGGNVLERLRRKARVSGRVPKRSEAVGPHHLSTEPADRERVAAAFRAYLRGDRLPIRWVGSPREVVEALGRALEATPLYSRPGDGPGWSIRAERDHWNREEGRRTDEERAIGEAAESIARAIGAAIQAASPTDLSDSIGILTDAGSFDTSSAPVWRPEERPEGLLAELRAACGPLVVLADEIIASERPLVLRLDDRDRPHAESGPAIAYPDGFTVFAWHGVNVPSWVIEDPLRITIESIDDERNAEVRRVMIERFGLERFVRDGGGFIAHEDATGRLWRRPLGESTGWQARDEPIVMVEVLNSTPEPDGTRKTYFLRVPPTMRTAREAVAWTFGMAGEAYAPVDET